jgi:hypothetical protein
MAAVPASTTDAQSADLQAAETFIDAFYSWDPVPLAAVLRRVPESVAASALYYQAWAEAGHYAIDTRRACAAGAEEKIVCAITVTDDIGGALGYVATDTFRFSVEHGHITDLQIAGDDPPIFEAVLTWMREDRPDVFSGPCKDLFAGGTTPAECVRAVVQGARDYRARSDR